MGERATIEIVDEAGESSPANIYLHWHGEPNRVCQFIKDAAKVMRKSNADYATARLVASICRAIDDNTDALSVGLQQPGDNEQAAILAIGRLFLLRVPSECLPLEVDGQHSQVVV